MFHSKTLHDLICKCTQHDLSCRQAIKHHSFIHSKIKSLADDKIDVTQKLKFVLIQVENILGKGKHAGYQHFLFLAHLSTTCSGGAIVTGHRPASVRPSVHPSVRPLTISLKIFSSKTRRLILIKLGRNVPWVKLYKNC